MDLIFIVYAIISILPSYFLFFIPLRNIYKFRTIRSYETVPIFGNIFESWKCHKEFNKLIERWAAKYGTEAIATWATYWFPIVIISKPDEVKKVLSSKEHVQKGLFYKAFDLVIGTGAFNCPVDLWRQRRPKLEQAFHSKVIHTLPTIFDKASRNLIQALKEDNHINGKVFDIHPYLNLTSIQMLIEGTWGMKVNVLGERKKPCWQQVNENYNKGTYLAEYRMLRPWFLFVNFLWELTLSGKEMRDCTNFLHTFFSMMVNKRRKTLALSQSQNDINNNNFVEKENRRNFMDLLLHLQKSSPELNLSEQDLIYELCSIYIAGHDASGKAMSFTLFYLGFHADCQEKVYTELQEIFGDDLDREVTEEDLGKMRYLEACLKESLRLMPPVSFIIRRVGCDIALDEKRIIPNGTEVAIATYIAHRNPEIYPQPEEFRPERFLLENSKGRHPYAWIPFSAGPRNCLGPKFAMMEMKVVLANILRHYRVESIGSKDNWVLNTNITIKLEGGWNVKLFSRY